MREFFKKWWNRVAYNLPIKKKLKNQKNQIVFLLKKFQKNKFLAAKSTKNKY